MHFLDAGGDVGGDDEAMVGEPFGGDDAAVAPGETRGDEAEPARDAKRLDHVCRGARGRQADEEVPRPAEGLDLAGEDPLEAEVVAGGGQGRCVGGERDRRKPRPARLETNRELGGDMLAVGGAAAVAAEEELAPGAEHRYSRFGEGRRRLEQAAAPLEDRHMVGEQALERRVSRRAAGRHANEARAAAGREVPASMDLSVIDRLAHANVLVVGDVLLDRFIDGKVSRVSPEAPVPVLKNGSSRALLGGAGNVAANLLSYGAAVTLVGAVGGDAAAAEMRTLCAGFHRLTAELIEDAARPTTVKARYLSGWHQLLRVDDEDQRPLPAAIADRLVDKATAALGRAKVLVLSDYAKGVLEPETVATLINAARRAGVPVVVDPKKADAAVFAGATLITPNAEEMARFAGLRIDGNDAAEAACRKLLAAVDVAAILVTRGEAGMTLVSRDGAPLHVAAESHRVYDVTGAGDTVVATLAAALAVGVPLADAVRLANTAAGIVVTKPGTAVAHPNELRRALGAAAATGVAADRAEAAEQVALWREQGLKVGFTNGCFDLLHRGHLHSLDQAARRVDRLVVGVNGDASVTRLKGQGRPVQDLQTRAALLAALRFVDLVVPFDEDTPEALIGTIVPDVLFKGADYAEADVAGGDFVKANGGRVELLPLLPGYSTTATVGRIRGGDKRRD